MPGPNFSLDNEWRTIATFGVICAATACLYVLWAYWLPVTW